MKKVVLITGCSRGLGKMLSERLAQKGYLVYAGIRNLQKSNEQTLLWKKNFPNIKAIKMDVTSDEDCRKAVKEILKKEKKLNVLINVVGYSLAGPVESFSTEDFKKIIDTNTIGAFRLIKEVVPLMKRQKGGRIINVTSLNGRLALPNFSIYCSSKFALEALALSARYELAKDNIWVTNVEPGAILNKEKSPSKLPHTPVREKFWFLRKIFSMVRPEEVCQAIEKVMEKSLPPAQVILGNDALITTFLQRYLPNFIWDKFLIYVWVRQNEKK